MSIGVLGPVTVDGTTAVPPRDRVLLSALIVRRGEVIHPDQLADALWRGEPPGSWRKVVQSTVVRLRKLLGTATIETAPSGYRLVAGEDDVDAWRFEHLVHRAAELAELHEHDRAADVLRRALALWRGEPFADLDGWSPGAAEAARLVELRRRAEERLVEARLALAEHGDVVGTARTLAAAEPLREQRWALLALALYRAERQGEALRALHEARMVLADQLGVEPGAELMALEAAILAHDTSLRAPLGPPPLTAASERCPYKGLEAYNESDRDAFFGRSTDLASCRRRLAASGVLVVVGASGSGKSSLLLAGVVPALREGGRRVSVCTPGADPSGALGAALSSVGGDAAIVVDQGEELFTACNDPTARNDFCAALLDHAARQPVVLALRADHVGEAASLPELARLIEAGMHLLGPMGEADLRTAIEGPARQAGLRLEAGLVDLLVRDVLDQPGALPLLSHALVEIWARREGRVLTVSAYRDSGGVHGAVSRSAEALYASLPDHQRLVTRSLFLRLVSATGDGEAVRHRLSRQMLATNQVDVVNTLVRARLLTASEDVLEIAHEALARAWPRLQHWLEEDQDGQRIHAHLSRTAEDWAERGQDTAELYRGARLEAATEWVGRSGFALSPTEAAFLAASTAQREREAADLEDRLRGQRRANRRLRGLLLGVAAALVLALVAATVATNQWNEAADQRDITAAARQTADAGRLAAQARLEVDDNLSRALLLAVEANRLEDGPTTRGSLQAALLHDPFLLGMLPAGGSGLASAAVSPDGSRLAVSGSDGTAQLWDAARRRRSGRTLPTGESSSAIAFSTDGKGLFSANHDSTVSAFDVANGSRQWRTSVEGRPWGVAVSPDDKLVAVSSTIDSRGRVTLLDARRATVVFALDQARPVNGLAFSPDGRMLIAGTGDASALADPAAGVIVWNVATRKRTAFLRGHKNGVSAVAFARDGRRFASTSTDETTIVWDTKRLVTVGAPLRDERITGNHLLSVAFSPDGRRLATGGAKVSIWDVERRRVVGEPLDARGGGAVLSLGFASAGRTLVAATAAGTAPVWDIAGQPALGTVVPGVGTDGGVLSPDGRFVAAIGTGPVPGEGIPQTITLVDRRTRRRLGESVGKAGPLVFSADGKRLALVGEDGSVRVIDAASRRVLSRPRAQKAPGSGLAFSPDGGLLAIGHFDGSIVLSDSVTGEPRGRLLRGHDGLVPFMAFRPDGDVLVTSSLGGGSIAWDLTRSPPRPRRLTDELSLRVIGVAFSPDGKLLATGATDGKVTFRDGRTFEPIGPPTVGAGVVQPVSFSADGRVLATSSDDRTVRLYDVASRQQIGIPFPKSTQYGNASFSPDGHTLVTDGKGGLVFWDVDPRSWARRACAAAGRNLTRAEWKRFLPDAGHYRRTCKQWTDG